MNNQSPIKIRLSSKYFSRISGAKAPILLILLVFLTMSSFAEEGGFIHEEERRLDLYYYQEKSTDTSKAAESVEYVLESDSKKIPLRPKKKSSLSFSDIATKINEDIEKEDEERIESKAKGISLTTRAFRLKKGPKRLKRKDASIKSGRLSDRALALKKRASRLTKKEKDTTND